MLLILIIIPFFGCVVSQDFIQEHDIIQVEEYTNLISILNYTNKFSWHYGSERYYEIIDNNYSKKFNTFTIDNEK